MDAEADIRRLCADALEPWPAEGELPAGITIHDSLTVFARANDDKLLATRILAALDRPRPPAETAR